jgi:hypothetical protein
LVALWATGAWAHSWYPLDCCSERDCRRIEASEVRELSYTQVLDLVTGTVVTGSKVRQSQDGDWHICNLFGDRKAKPLCVFRPVPSY